MREEAKYFNSYLDKLIARGEKLVAEINQKRSQMGLFKSSEAEQAYLLYAQEGIDRIVKGLSKFKEWK